MDLYDILTKNDILTGNQYYALVENHMYANGYTDDGDDKVSDGIAYVKLFNATGIGTWWLSELDPDTGIAFGKAHLLELEFGYFSLLELLDTHWEKKMMLERDLYYRPKFLTDVTIDDVYPTYADEQPYATQTI